MVFIMSYEASRKVSDGKLVNIEFDLEDNRFKNVNITGDFFVQPPSALEDLKTRLEGEKPESNLKNVLEDVEADLIGFSREDIAKTVQKALGDQK